MTAAPGRTHSNARLEAFCDGVFAIALTLLIIDVRLPPGEVTSTAAFWEALARTGPSVLAFLLSFAVILITWVNHHGAFALMNGSSQAFIYANGLLLLSVVFIPFPTSLLGEHLLTEHAGPAVAVYDAVIAVQALGWVLVFRTALRDGLAVDESAVEFFIQNKHRGYAALVTYSLGAAAALWIPRTIASVTAALWVYWLIWGVRGPARSLAHAHRTMPG